MVGRGYLGGRCGTCGRLYKVEKGDCISTPHISGQCYPRVNHWRLDVKNNIGLCCCKVETLQAASFIHFKVKKILHLICDFLSNDREK